MISHLPLEVTLWHHLRYNIYPPVPSIMLQPAKEAIEACNAGEGEKNISLSEGARHKEYGEMCPADVLVESLRLESFLDSDWEE